MFCGVANACHRDAVHKNRGAAFGGGPCVGAAAFAVPSRVANAKHRASVDQDVRRTAHGWSADAVGAAGTAVGITRAVCLVSDSANWGHETSMNDI